MFHLIFLYSTHSQLEQIVIFFLNEVNYFITVRLGYRLVYILYPTKYDINYQQ